MTDLRFALGPGQILTTDDPGTTLDEVLSAFGSRVGVVAGDVGWPLLRQAGWDHLAEDDVLTIAAPASDSTIDQVASWARNRDVLVGVGGGKVIDIAKTAADRIDKPVITVPTSAATCACSASLSVLYGDDGGFSRSVAIKRIAALVVPRNIVREAPARLLVSGVFDALAKLPELDWQLRTSGFDLAALPFATGLARRIAADIFVQLGGELIAWRQQGAPEQWSSDFVSDDTVLAATVGAALVTGTQPPTHPGVAHALYYEHRNRVPRPELLHGEVVGTGILVQLIMNGAPQAEIDAFRSLLEIYRLPTTITPQIMELSDESISQWAAKCLATPEQLVQALDALS
ncbi:iron-containing alcohol dehydrogenase [Propionibacteriaceae bacterium Y1700]|uniref:iron-containing alcohol dehydrogenase n=1 Tax=Microlunatus sp. Y1700 TaxID=3418487 RepID=UPI003DA6E315